MPPGSAAHSIEESIEPTSCVVRYLLDGRLTLARGIRYPTALFWCCEPLVPTELRSDQWHRTEAGLRRNNPDSLCRAVVRVWQNWQTQHVGNVRGFGPCGFKSHHPHPGLLDVAERRADIEIVADVLHSVDGEAGETILLRPRSIFTRVSGTQEPAPQRSFATTLQPPRRRRSQEFATIIPDPAPAPSGWQDSRLVPFLAAGISTECPTRSEHDRRQKA